MTGQQNLIERFLQLKRIAVVGVSRTPGEFSRMLWQEFRARGIDAVPVNPHQAEIDNVRCFSRVQEITPPVKGALILVAKKDAAGVVNDCAEAGIGLVWAFGIRGAKDVDPAVVALCEEQGIALVAGHCPLMFLSETPWYHGVHRFVWKAVGLYPK